MATGGGAGAPQVEIDTLNQVVEDADILAGLGAITRGALLPARGLQRARAIEEPWGAELARRYQEALDGYVEQHQMKTPGPGPSLWRDTPYCALEVSAMAAGAGSSKSRIVIGVIGNSNVDLGELDNQLLLFTAYQLGLKIAQNGEIVLTGGHHARQESSVKHYALLGALASANYGPPARIIGILPDNVSNKLTGYDANHKEKVEPIDPSNQARLSVYIHTGLSSKGRNPITGATVDVMIALRGVKGTPQEAAATLNAGRPVVLLNSRSDLEDGINRHLTGGRTVANLITAGMIQEASSVDKAVAIATKLAGNQPIGEYPANTANPNDSFVDEARKAIQALRVF